MGKVKNLVQDADMYTTAKKHGYLDKDGEIRFDKMARDRKWVTKDGTLLKYKDITDEHLKRILALFEDGKFHIRDAQYEGLRAEFWSRVSPAGEVLYGSN